MIHELIRILIEQLYPFLLLDNGMERAKSNRYYENFEKQNKENTAELRKTKQRTHISYVQYSVLYLNAQTKNCRDIQYYTQEHLNIEKEKKTMKEALEANKIQELKM